MACLVLFESCCCNSLLQLVFVSNNLAICQASSSFPWLFTFALPECFLFYVFLYYTNHLSFVHVRISFYTAVWLTITVFKCECLYCHFITYVPCPEFSITQCWRYSISLFLLLANFKSFNLIYLDVFSHQISPFSSFFCILAYAK